MISCVAAFVAGQGILARKDIGASIVDPGVLRAVLGGALYLTAIGLLGLVLGTLLRRTSGAVATLLGILLVLPILTHALPAPWGTNITKYLPSQAGQALFSVRHTFDLLHPGAGLAVLAGYVAAALLAATLVLSRRDS